MKRCPYCGAEYPDELAQCPTDHTTLVSSTSAQPATSLPPTTSPLGLAIASLVLGIVSVTLSFLLIGAVLALVGGALGCAHLAKKRHPVGMAGWGIGLSVLGLIASLGCAAFYYSTYKQVTRAMQSASEGEDLTKWEGVKAPELEVTTLDGKTLKLSAFKGTRVVLDFWATWCPPCRKEIPHFVRLFNETSRDKLMIIGVSDEPAATLNKFVRDNGITYPIATATNLPPPYGGLSAIPTTFYIDTKGIIQKIDVGYHEYADIRQQALAEDYKGVAKEAPATPKPLPDASLQLKPEELWSTNIPGAQALCVGEWLGDGKAQVLVAAGPKLHILDLGGTEVATVPLPERFQIIECGRNQAQGARLLGYDNWGRTVTVLDARGTKLWQVRSLFGVDGAHWGDLDGDGTDELIVGMNGGGGLQAWSSEGKRLWSVKLGNVWNQAIISAVGGQPAVVFATEAGGSVKVFDASGTLTRTLRPDGGYYAQMAACRTGQGIQVAAISGDETVVFDTTGKVLWTTSALSSNAGWRECTFACGDLDGDGGPDWVFVDGSRELVIANAKGEKISAISNGNTIGSFAVAPRKGNRGVLVALSGSMVKAYELKP